ncbi:hypothetical protein ES708_15483 [subsurface metagenome]
MKNVFLSVVVVATLVAAGVGGTFAGFVDTEISEGNFVQAGISDLLVNGKNDPIGAKVQFIHATPCTSLDFWIDLYNWGECQGGDVYMHFKDVVSVEAGTKTHIGAEYVYDGTSTVGGGIPDGYRVATGDEPYGAGVWSSEPEKIAEVGGGWVGQYYVDADHNCLLGEDYASGISDHLDVTVTVPLKGATGTELGNPDTGDGAGGDPDGTVDATEKAAWVTNGNRWEIIASLSGKLVDIECTKNYLGLLKTQEMTFVHVDVHLQQIACPDWPDEQTMYWPTNALQGDKATWSMMWELITD